MESGSKTAVVGATGRLGRHLVDVLEERGHDVVAISRSNGIDVVTAERLTDALAGVETVLDVASTPSPERQAATEFFTKATRNLQEVGERCGVQRIVAVSIIGTDGFTGGYGAAKQVHEQLMLSGPIPAQLLRAAQFHEFVPQLVDWGRDGDVSQVPEMRFQPVAARTVAEALADLAMAPEPANEPIPEIAGPREESLVEVAGRLAERRGEPVRIEGLTEDDDRNVYADVNGGLLPNPHAKLAGPTFEEWLDAQY
jgi:uncharacterized protein YbjT (DUF2867 family)